jgi:hypothetical protein
MNIRTKRLLLLSAQSLARPKFLRRLIHLVLNTKNQKIHSDKGPEFSPKLSQTTDQAVQATINYSAKEYINISPNQDLGIRPPIPNPETLKIGAINVGLTVVKHFLKIKQRAKKSWH